MTIQDANPSEPDNDPIALPEQAKINVTSSPSKSVDRALWYTIGGIVLVTCCGLILLAFLFTRTSQFKELTTFPIAPDFDYTPYPTPDIRATDQAWKPPSAPPSLGIRKEVESALKKDETPQLTWFATYRPLMPDINQPGDVYTYAVNLFTAQEVLWDYGWCTLTQKILDENFAQMEIEFFLNGKAVEDDRVGIEDYQASEERFCRTYNVLVKNWPKGTHLLSVDVTFLAPTDDGWNVYPAGTHTFQYFVTVNP